MVKLNGFAFYFEALDSLAAMGSRVSDKGEQMVRLLYLNR
jgi:hypothetical protein